MENNESRENNENDDKLKTKENNRKVTSIWDNIAHIFNIEQYPSSKLDAKVYRVFTVLQIYIIYLYIYCRLM